MHRDLAVFDGKQRLPRLPLKNEHMSGLGDLSHGVYRTTVPLDGHQVGTGGKIAVPEIVPHSLEMPYALARVSLESQQRVCAQIVARAVSASEVEWGRGRGYEPQPGLFRHAQARP